MAETKDVTLRLLIETVGNTNKALEDIVNSLNRVVSQFDKLASSAGKAGKDATNALIP
jgi:hypothetical protein